MKFDAYQWKEVEIGQEIVIPQGRLVLRLSRPGAVYITQGGYEALAGYGADHDYQVTGPATYRCEAEAARAFVKQPDLVVYQTTGAVFTNADRMPTESGTMLEVTKAMRLFQFQQQQTLREMRTVTRELNEAREKAREKQPEQKPAEKPAEEKQPEEKPAENPPEQKPPVKAETDKK